MSSFPVTSVTLIQKIKTLSPGEDDAEWVRFWDTYSGAIRTFAARKGGDENADDIVMTVLGRLVEVLRTGQYTPEKGAFHSYLASMIINEVHMLHRKDTARGNDRKISLDAPVAGADEGGEEDERTLGESLPAEESQAPESLDEDWRQAVLASAVDHVLNRTALSQRDKDVYREYAQEGRPIEEVAAKYRISRNFVSQIKTRIDKRIIAVGREFVAGSEKM